MDTRALPTGRTDASSVATHTPPNWRQGWRGWAAIVGVPVALVLAFYANFSAIDHNRIAQHSMNVVPSYILAIVSFLATVGVVATIVIGEVLRRAQGLRGLSTVQIVGFALVGLFFFAILLGTWVVAAQGAASIWPVHP